MNESSSYIDLIFFFNMGHIRNCGIEPIYKKCHHNIQGGSRVSPLMQMTKSHFLPMKYQAA